MHIYQKFKNTLKVLKYVTYKISMLQNKYMLENNKFKMN